MIINKHRKIGRNEQCPCGSMIKYKKCCGKVLREKIASNVMIKRKIENAIKEKSLKENN